MNNEPSTTLSANHPLGKVLNELDRVNLVLYDTLTIPLDTARDKVEFPYAGDTFSVEQITGSVSVQLHDNTKTAINLAVNRKIVSPFRRFYITNSAQPGKTLVVTIGRDASFDTNPIPSTRLTDVNASDINPAEMSTTPELFAITMTLADTQYSQALPSGTKKFTAKTRDGTAFRTAYVTGKVATPTDPYNTVPANASMYEDFVKLSGVTLYFACSAAGKIVEITAWS